MTQKIYTIVIFLLFSTLNKDFYSQENNIPITVNNLIGDTLSKEERDYYKLFPQIEGFQSAVFYLNSDSILSAKVYYRKDGLLTDTLVQNYRTLQNLNYHIYARDALEKGLPIGEFINQASGNEKGAEVSAYMNDGRETSGELLSVRANSILLFNSDCDKRLLKQECINQINANEINKLVIEGNSNLGWGIGLGLLAAVVAGATVFQSYNDGSFLWGRDAILPTILSTVGCITLGVTIGIFTSTPDEEIKIYSEEDIRGLSYYSRYPNKEPDELQKVK